MTEPELGMDAPTRPLVPARLSVFIGVLLVLGVVSWLVAVPMTPFVSNDYQVVGVLLLVALFAAAELFPVHLHFIGNTHTFSLSEIPITLGLFFLAPHLVIGARLVGSGGTLLFHRKQPKAKLLFNLASFMLTDRLAVAIFRWWAGQHGTFTTQAMVAAAFGALGTALLSAALVSGVIRLAEGKRPNQGAFNALRFGVVSALFTTSLGLIGVAVITAYPSAAWLLAIPTAGLQIANWAYAKERRRHQGLSFLHNSTKMLHQSPELDAALTVLVSEARKAFRCAQVQVAYLPAGSDTAMRVVANEDDVSLDTFTFAGSDVAEIVSHIEGLHGPQIIHHGDENSSLGTTLADAGLIDAIVTPLRANGRVCGLVLAGNRLGDLARFDKDDRVLIETLADTVAAALENGRLERSLDQLRRMEGKLTHQANHDELTGLANRSLFARVVTEQLDDEAASGSVAVLFVDLDDFKTVNDSLGHAAGDDLLVALGRRLAIAIPENATAARLGGDEFAVVLPGMSGARQVTDIAEHLLATIGAPVAVMGRVVPIHASIGAALATGGQNAADLLRNADTAMYAAKNMGKHRVAVFESALHEAAVHRYNVTFELRRAVKDHEFTTYYQPIVDLATQHIVTAEALVRWQHPTLGLLSPAAFIGIAEESDTIVHVGRQVLSASCQLLSERQLRTPGGDPIRIAVNLSARDLFTPNLVADLSHIIEEFHVDPTSLVFEITEGAMITNPEGATRSLLALKDLGVRVALDDFGTGYSSLSQLGRLPVDVIKIAQPFIDEMNNDAKGGALVEAIIRLSQTLGLTIVAEGIEYSTQAERLLALGCDLGQGFFFARPMPEDAFVRLVQDRAQASLLLPQP